MNRAGWATIGVIVMTGLSLAACSQPAAPARVAAVDAAVQQRVKNGCVAQLEAQASVATPPPGVLHPQKAKLSQVVLEEIRQVKLPGGATGYEMGMRFNYKLGHDDPRAGSKLCRINLADSSVVWLALK